MTQTAEFLATDEGNIYINFDQDLNQWIILQENDPDAPGGILLGCVDERPDIPKKDPSTGGAIYIPIAWDKLAELHAAIGDVLTRRPA
jgi:hypothetical protein